jgi:hypothetical protein
MPNGDVPGPADDVWRRPDGADPVEPPPRPPSESMSRPQPDESWARPDTWSSHPGATTPTVPPDPPPPSRPIYTGPPPTTMPPPDWRPATVLAVPPPDLLPPQRDDVIDAAEAQARTVTYGVGMIAGAVVLILLAVICGRIAL